MLTSLEFKLSLTNLPFLAYSAHKMITGNTINMSHSCNSSILASNASNTSNTNDMSDTSNTGNTSNKSNSSNA